ncbi:MAG: WYL domain-containing protein [Proteobacteria bacterium]|nr:WYL domain-containing protein [Pseudomonadota bacterium]
MNRQELRALFMTTIPEIFKDLDGGEHLKSALLKLTAALPKARRIDAEQVQNRIHIDSSPWFANEEKAPYLDTIQKAIWQNRELKLLYRKRDGTTVPRRIQPYGLVAKAGIWYLVRSREGEMAAYRVSRIVEADLTDHYFERQPDFDLPVFWKTYCREFEASRPVYPVTVNFSSEIIPYLNQIFGDGLASVFTENPTLDEKGRLKVDLTFETKETALVKLAGLGAKVEVLEPKKLRDDILNMARKTVGLYSPA